MIIDALGAAGTKASLLLLTTEVFANDDSSPQDIMNALVHLVNLKVCPPEVSAIIVKMYFSIV